MAFNFFKSSLHFNFTYYLQTTETYTYRNKYTSLLKQKVFNK